MIQIGKGCQIEKEDLDFPGPYPRHKKTLYSESIGPNTPCLESATAS